MNWDDLRVFDALLDAPTLSAAARRLNTSLATLSRRLAALEDALGVQLVLRTPGGIELSEDGRDLAAHLRAAAQGVREFQHRAEQVRKGEARAIRLSATEPVATELLAPALPPLQAQFPDLRLDVIVTSEVLSIAGRDADIAIRFTPPSGDSLVAQRLPDFTLGLYASAAVLAGRNPGALRLEEEVLIAYDESLGLTPEAAWIDRNGLSKATRLRTSSTRFILNATLAGAGIGLLPDVLARRPGLTAIPTGDPIPPRPLWLVTHRDGRNHARQQAVRAWVRKIMGDARRASGVA